MNIGLGIGMEKNLEKDVKNIYNLFWIFIFAPQITQMGTDYILLFNSFLCNKSHSCCKAYFTSSSCVKGMKYVISNDGTAANST